MGNSYSEKVVQHIADNKVLNFPKPELAFTIMLSAKDYPDDEVSEVIRALDPEIISEIRSMISDYEETGEYYVISSTGTTRDLSELMGRLSKLVGTE